MKEMRRKDRMLSETDAAQILEHALFGVLSTVDADGIPYGVPLSYAYDGDSIYFHCAPVGHKLDNISAQDQVSFCVVSDVETLPAQFSTKYKSVIIFGTVQEVTGDAKTDAFMMLIKKYSPAYLDSGAAYIEKSGHASKIFRIKIERMTAKGRV